MRPELGEKEPTVSVVEGKLRAVTSALFKKENTGRRCCSLLCLLSETYCLFSLPAVVMRHSQGVGWAVLRRVCQEREGAGLVCVVTAQSTVT